MKLNTKYHDEVEIEEKDIIHFKQGIPGFLEEKHFIILPFSEDSSFFILQSSNTQDLAFILANPFVFFANYEYKLNNQIIEQLSIETNENVATYVILTVKEPFHLTTANLQAPVVVNVKNNLAKQIILNDSGYTTKHHIVPKPSSLEQEG